MSRCTCIKITVTALSKHLAAASEHYDNNRCIILHTDRQTLMKYSEFIMNKLVSLCSRAATQTMSWVD